MAEDRREQILARLLVVCKETMEADSGFAFRNRADVPEKSRPAVVILDADEEADEASYARGRPANGPVMVRLTPQMLLVLQDNADAVGPALNALRVKLLKAILTDAPLLALCKDGDVRYNAFSTSLAVGRNMEGFGGLSLTFVYALRPAML